MKITEYTDINNLLSLLLDQLQLALKDELVGVYLYGSLVYGDFDHEVSDIDLMVATSNHIDQNQFLVLKKIHDDIYIEYPEWKDRIEIAYISIDALKTFKLKRSQIAVVSPGEPFNIKDAGIDWLINWYQIQERGKTLLGPPPKEIINPISKEEFIKWIQSRTGAWREWIHNSNSLKRHQTYLTLTMCRALHAYETGKQVSKKVAAKWVMEELPEWSSLLENALLSRMSSNNVDVDNESTLLTTQKFANQILDRIETASKTIQ